MNARGKKKKNEEIYRRKKVLQNIVLHQAIIDIRMKEVEASIGVIVLETEDILIVPNIGLVEIRAQ